jgi:DNA gyrase subunit A
MLRTPVSGDRGVRITGRNAQGVIIFDVGPDERVVSVARIGETGENGDESEGGGGEEA